MGSFWEDITTLKSPSVFENNLREKDIEEIVPIKNSIWTDVLKVWNAVTYVYPKTKRQVLQQYLNYNSHIKINNKVMQGNYLQIEAIQQVSDIYDEQHNKFYTYQELQLKQGQHINYLRYWSLLAAIPKEWKLILETDRENQDDPPTWLQTISTVPKAPKWGYPKLLRNAEQYTEQGRTKWTSLLGAQIDQQQWQKIRLDSYYLSISTKLRDFQYRLLSYKITMYKLRHTWDKNVTDRCALCTKQTETILHLMYECKKVQKIWKNFVKWCKYLYKITVDINPQMILCNNYTR